MRSYILLLASCLGLIFTTNISAQHHHHLGDCGMSRADLDEVAANMMRSRAEMKNFVMQKMTTYVPVRFHLVANSSGEGRATDRQALQALCNMNENFADHDIQFYLREPDLSADYINNNAIYNDPDSFSGQLNINSQMNYDAINIFVVNSVDDGGGGGSTLAYYQPPAGPNGNDWIVCLKSWLTDERVLTHEVGHFFDLLHPFNGWDFNPYDGGPVTGSTSPEGVPIEKVDGSNCEVAGDFLCDTPADYNFIQFDDGNCNYTGGATDPMGDLLDPDEMLFMNYFVNCSSYYFSEDQEGVMLASLNSSSRNYVTPNYTPNTDEIEGNISLVSPGNLQTVNGYNAVYLSWTPMSGADYYLVELSGAQNLSFIATGSTILLENELEANSTYLWRVTPYNEFFTCANSSIQQIFKTPGTTTNVKEVDQIEDWTVVPNPVSSNETLTISIDSKESFEANISLYNLAGVAVKTIPSQQLSAGSNVVTLSTDNLPAGLYTVAIQNENGISQQRLVVSQ